MARTIIKRITALFLIISLTFGNVAFVGKTYATELFLNWFNGNDEPSFEWNDNVAFETYFEKDGQKSLSVISDVNSYDTDLKLELNVGESGYIKESSIEILSEDDGNLNFEISDTRKVIEEVEIKDNETDEITGNTSVQGGENLSLGNEIQVLSIGGEENPMNTSLTLDMSEGSETTENDNEVQTDESMELVIDPSQTNTENEQPNDTEKSSGEPLIMDLSTPSSEEKNDVINNEENVTEEEQNAEKSEGNENEVENVEEKIQTKKELVETNLLDEYKEYIDTIENNKIQLKQLNSKANLKLSIPIEYKNEDYINESKLYNTAKVRYTGKYVDENGKEHVITKEYEINVGWRNVREVKASQEITKYIDFGSGVIIQTKIKLDNTIEENDQQIELSMNDNYLPVEETKLSIQAPKYMDMDVSGVAVSAIKLDATNGEATGTIKFDENNWNYNPETGKVEITVRNEKKATEEKLEGNEVLFEEEQEDKIYNIPGEDEYIVTYTYTDVEVPEEGVEIESNIEASQQFYSAFTVDEVKNMVLGSSNGIDLSDATTSKTELNTKVELKENVGDIISAENSVETESISKKYAYLNYRNEEKIENEIITNDIINVSYSDIVENIKIKDEKVVYATENTEEVTSDVYYKRIELSKDNFIKILGEEGTIDINDENGQLITSINNQSFENNEEDILEVNIENQKKIEIVTSKPLNEGMLTIKKVRAVKENTVPREIYINLSKIKLVESVSAKYQYVDTDTNIAEVVSEVKLENTKTDANLKIDRESFATLAENENVEFVIELNNNNELSDIYGNSHFEIELPAYITKIELGDVNISDAAGLEIENARVESNKILIDLKGIQKNADVGMYSNGTNIVLYANIDVHDYTPATTDVIKLTYSNEEATNYSNPENSGKEVKVSYSAPIGLVAVNDIKMIENGAFVTSVRQGLKEDLIATHRSVQYATMGLTLINNNPNEVSDIRIIGQFPCENLVDPITGNSLGTTINAIEISKIRPADTNSQGFKTYYSEKLEVDNNLDNPENGWTENPENMENMKSYLIISEDEAYSMKPYELLRFSYSFAIPADLTRYQTLSGIYRVDYKNHSNIGETIEYTSPDIVRLTTGEGPEVTLDIETEKIKAYTGKEFTVKAIIKNEGREKVNNIKLRASNLNAVEFVKYESEDERVVLDETDRNTEIALSINSLDIIDEVAIELRFKVKGNTDSETSDIEINFEVSADGLDNPVTKKTDVIKILSSEVSIYQEILGTGNKEKKYDPTKNEEYLVERYYYEEEEITFKTEVTNYREDALKNIELSMIAENGNLDYVNSRLYRTTYSKERGFNTEELGSGRFDENTQKAIYTIDEIPGSTAYYFEVTYKTKKIDDNYDFVQETVYSEIKSENLDNDYQSDKTDIKIAKPNVEIKQITEVKNDYIKIGDTIEYKFSVENKGKVRLERISFEDVIPEELSITNASYLKKNNNGEYETFDAIVDDGVAKVTMSLGAEETALVNIDAVARTTNGSIEKTVSNKGTITGNRIDEESSESVLHIIRADSSDLEDDQEQEGVFRDSEIETTGLLTSNNRISGKIWFDENENGIMDNNETVNGDMKNITISLLNLDTGKAIKSVKAGAQGEYRFAGLSKGRYSIVYEYDTVKYAITTYKKSNSSELSNSDAYAGKISKNGKVVNVAVTDEIVIENTNVDGINLGLISAQKFDLEISMGISKISVQSGGDTKTVNYNGENFAKEEISAKNIKGSKVIIEYNIEVKNTGDIKGFAKRIVDYLPEDMEFNSSYTGNDKWYTSKDGNIYTNSLEKTEINPGESKKISLVLSKNMTEENTGLISNQVEIYEDYNIYGITDIDSKAGNKVQKEDDHSIADVLVLIKTGDELLYTSAIITVLIISLITGLAVYGKVHHEADNKWNNRKEEKHKSKGKNYK